MHLFVRACSNLFRSIFRNSVKLEVTLGKTSQVHIVKFSYFMEKALVNPQPNDLNKSLSA